MEDAEKHNLNESVNELAFDFSKQALKKIESATVEQSRAVILILNDNEIQKLDNLDSYANLRKLYLANNQLIRMYGVSNLINLEILDLTNNLLVTIEGLKDLKNLKKLYLAKNKIKGIEHLNNNLQLEEIDLSENCISYISDISYLDSLKELYLHKNRITNLTHCEKNLPKNLEIITLHSNLICDLNEISHFVNFQSLKKLSFTGNPCVDFKDNNAFNYRPFIKNWCTSLLILDEVSLDDIECLKAEWLYSQGRGRSFRIGENTALAEYLSSVCPYIEPDGETEDVKKLKLILSKAQQHQQQLQEELSTGTIRIPEHYKTKKKKSSGVPEKMVSSFQDSFSRNNKYSNELMTRSLDLGILRNSPSKLQHQPLQSSTTFIPVPDSLISPDVCHSVAPFSSCKKASPSNRTSRSSSRNSSQSTPEGKRKVSTISLKRQNCSPVMLKKNGHSNASRCSVQLEKNSSPGPLSPLPNKKGARENERNRRESSDEDGSTVLSANLEQNLTQKKKQFSELRGDQIQVTSYPVPMTQETCFDEKVMENVKESLIWKAAVCIQRRWRGYRARNINAEVLNVCKELQILRMQEYIIKIVGDVEATRIAVEGNRKLQILQIQAINALWKKIIAFQPNEVLENPSESKLRLQTLGETCATLNKQVEELYCMVKDMQISKAPALSVPNATQTQISDTLTREVEENQKMSDRPTENSCFSLSEEFPSSTILVNHSESSMEESKEIYSVEPDVTELFSNRNAKVSSSSQELFLSSKSVEAREAKFINVKLNKPSVMLNEILPELLNTGDPAVSGEKECEKSDIQNGCDSKV